MNKGKLLLMVGVVVMLMLGMFGGIACVMVKAPMAEVPFISPQTCALMGGLSTKQGLFVAGEGKVMAVPDVAIFSLGIEAEAKTVAEAQRQATEAMNKVMKAVRGHGVLEKDIQTQQFSIYPVKRVIPCRDLIRGRCLDVPREEIIAYRVVNRVSVKIRQIDKAGVIVDDTVKAGGDLIRIHGINFIVDDPSAYYQKAREKAVKDAVAKAKQIAEVAGIKLGKPIYIAEEFIAPVVPRVFIEKALSPAPPPTPIAPGELEIRVNVHMIYKID